MAERLTIRSRRFMGQVWELAAPYWRSEEKWRARLLLAAIVAMTLGIVYMLVLFNDWNKMFYDALEKKNEQDFFGLMLYFSFIAAIYVALQVYRLYLQQMLEVRWRIWLTRQYLGEWMSHRVYYRLELDPLGTDNPDQRIAEDLRTFTRETLSLTLGLLREVVTVVSFVTILWVISGPLTFTALGTEVTIPGYMLWAALIYAGVGSALTYFIGRPLIRLNFEQERREADFRFNLVRMREYAEGVALYGGESAERERHLFRLERIRQNWYALMFYTKRLGAFTVGYAQVAIVLPFFIAGHRYFSGQITLGGLTQIGNSYDQMRSSLSWFVDNYDRLASWKASVDRLLTFHHAVERATAEAQAKTGERVAAAAREGVHADIEALALPGKDGVPGRVLLSGARLDIQPGERVLIAGPSGSGKSTLFRLLAGIWPFGRARVQVPQGARMLFLPQKPYIPIGTLRDAVTYPNASVRPESRTATQATDARAFSDTAIAEALRAAGLDGRAERLGDERNWSMALSGGEQQRLAVARALLHEPDWLFLDEATSALDEAGERSIYELLRERLPNTTLVSIAHRPSVAGYHDRRITLAPEGGRMVLSGS